MNCEYGEPPLLLKPHLVEIKVSCKFNIQVLALSPVCNIFQARNNFQMLDCKRQNIKEKFEDMYM